MLAVWNPTRVQSAVEKLFRTSREAWKLADLQVLHTPVKTEPKKPEILEVLALNCLILLSTWHSLFRSEVSMFNSLMLVRRVLKVVEVYEVRGVPITEAQMELHFLDQLFDWVRQPVAIPVLTPYTPEPVSSRASAWTEQVCPSANPLARAWMLSDLQMTAWAD